MIPASFDYRAPTSVEEALQALADAGDDAKVIAGGQSLLPVLRMRLNAPAVVVDLGRIDSLRGIALDGDTLVIGAMTSHAEIAASDVVGEHAGLLRDAVRTVADPQVRHRGTIGGAVAHADPAGDYGAPLLALDATMVVAGPGGTREVPAADFFTGLFETSVGEDELLTAVRVPTHAGWGFAYEKFVRTAQQWAIVAVAATVRVDGGAVAAAGVGLTNMGSTPVRARAAEAALVGQPATADAVAQAAAHAAEEADPPTDLNGTAEYRSHLARVLTRRALSRAAGI